LERVNRLNFSDLRSGNNLAIPVASFGCLSLPISLALRSSALPGIAYTFHHMSADKFFGRYAAGFLGCGYIYELNLGPGTGRKSKHIALSIGILIDLVSNYMLLAK